MNVFDCQVRFLESVEQMIADEEIFFDGEEALGFETLITSHRVMMSELVETEG